MAAGGSLYSESAWKLAYAQVTSKVDPKLVTPVRALVRRDGSLFQPLKITIEQQGAGAVAAIKVDGVEKDRRTLQSGPNTFELYLKPATEIQSSTVSLEINGAVRTETVELKPVRQMLIYILPHSHHDLGYTDLQGNIEEKQILNITRGIELARKTAGYPEGSRFVWNLEVLWGADLYMKRGSEEAKSALIEAVQKGWVGLNGAYANELTGLCRAEELLQLFYYSTQLGKTCGIKVDSAMMSDVPGFSWGVVPAMSQAGIKYFSAAPNYFDRIGAFMVTWQDKPFWWVSPSGKEKILFWVPWTGYALSHVKKLGAELVGAYQDRMDDVHYPYDISYMRWSGHGDNAEPDPELSEFVREWNEKCEWPKFAIASTSTAFSAFEERYGSQLPQYRGDLTPYWEDGAASSALETGLSRIAADRLSQATALCAVDAPKSYVPPTYEAAWRDVLLYSEHTWGAWCSVSDSENPFTRKQWEVKRQFALDAARASKDLLHDSLGSLASDLSYIDVHNSTSWDRTEVIYLPHDLSAAGDHVADHKGKPVPSQRLSTGELAVLVTDVPAFASARYTISSRKPYHAGIAVSVKDGVLENGLLRARIDMTTGNIVELNLRGSSQNLIDVRVGNGANEYLYMSGKDVEHLGRIGPAKIAIEDNGPLVASLRIESSAPSCNSLVRRMRLAAGMRYVELFNLVDKQRAPLNPSPGKGGPGDEFAQRGSKESLQFAFPFSVPGGKMSMDIALGNMRPEIDQLPGSCKNWLPVGRWIDVSNDDYGVTWATLDAPLVEIGGVTATMLGSQRDPSVWRKHIEPTQTFYSWIMNNHWGTNYLAYQQGKIEFRYALRPHERDDAAAASRFAIGLTEPLLVAGSNKELASTSFLRVEPADVLALTLKPSEDGQAWIVRIFGASGETRQAKLTWSSPTGKTWISNLAEAQLSAASEEIAVAGWELVTLRVERT
jgi:alpha-mannosidase